MRLMINAFAALAVTLVLMTATSGTAVADAALDTHRTNGVIAERYDGYVEIRGSGASSDAHALVADVNARRRALYLKRANELNVPVTEVGNIYATEIIKAAPSGTYFLQLNGNYIQN